MFLPFLEFDQRFSAEGGKSRKVFEELEVCLLFRLNFFQQNRFAKGLKRNLESKCKEGFEFSRNGVQNSL